MGTKNIIMGFVVCGSVLVGCVTKVYNSDGTVQTKVVDKQKLSDTYVNLALEYQKHDAPQIAMDRVNLAIATNSSNSRAYMVRGLIYAQLNKPDMAEDNFKKAIKINSNDPDSYINYAVFLCGQKRYLDAEKNFITALNNPLYFTPEVGYYNRGKCYYQQGNYTLANADYMQVLTYKNVLPETYVALAQLHLNQTRYQLAKYYIDRYSGMQTPETLWLHIQILQSLIDSGTDNIHSRENTSYRDTLAMVLVDDYPNSPEAQKSILRYGQPRSVSKTLNLPASSASLMVNNQVPIVNVNNTKSVPSVNKSQTNNILASPLDNVVPQTDASGRRYIIVPPKATAFSISKKFNLTIQQLEKYNGVRTSQVAKGAKLYIDPQ